MSYKMTPSTSLSAGFMFLFVFFVTRKEKNPGESEQFSVFKQYRTICYVKGRVDKRVLLCLLENKVKVGKSFIETHDILLLNL